MVFDECLWWLLSKTQDLFTRKACGILKNWESQKVRALPMILDLVVLPFLDYLHMVPSISKAL